MTHDLILIDHASKTMALDIERLLERHGMPTAWPGKAANRLDQGEIGCVITGHAPGSDPVRQGHAAWGTAANIPFIVLVHKGDVSGAVQAVKSGAFDVIETPLDETRLTDSVTRALAFNEAFEQSNGMARTIARRVDSLTRREAEVLAALVTGRSNKEIAHDMAISVRTVEVHRAHLMFKMRARNLPHLVRMALAVNGVLLTSLSGAPQGIETGLVPGQINLAPARTASQTMRSRPMANA